MILFFTFINLRLKLVYYHKILGIIFLNEFFIQINLNSYVIVIDYACKDNLVKTV